MYEVKSCGTSIDFCHDLFSASHVYDQCKGPHIQMYKYDTNGNKVLTKEKFSNMRVVSSKQVQIAVTL